MATQTQICNMALQHIGSSEVIANIDERSKQALICRTFYDLALEATLRDFPWPFATKTIDLGLVEEDPTIEWRYSYQYPTDCLDFRRIPNGVWPETVASRIPYRLVYGQSGTLIYTNQVDAEGEYTMRITDASRFPADFVIALSYRLADMIVPSLSKGDLARISDRILRKYDFEISKARASAVNEENPGLAPESEFITVRD
jgi:hypothetical protein